VSLQAVAHLNIKPKNLLLTNNSRRLKVGELSIMTKQLAKHESLAYMAPEV